jgi:hypothetical protein
MKYSKLTAFGAAVVLTVSGTLAVASPAQGNGLVPIAAPAPLVEETRSAGIPPAPTKQDKVHKASTKEKTGKKGYPNKDGITTFACPCYDYVVASDVLGAGETGDGFAVNLPVENTYKSPSDSHVLAQLAVNNNAGEIIEFGITRDSGVFADAQPRLFAGYRVNGVFQGYGVGFTDYAANTTETYGTAVPVVPGTQRRFEVKYSAGNWWMSYDLRWIGYFSGSLFTAPNTFTNASIFQAFFEVAHSNPSLQTCTDLGNGLPASNTSAARIGSMAITGLVPSTTVVGFGSYIQPTTAYGYTVTPLSATTFRGGGPGANAALTGVGTTGAC